MERKPSFSPPPSSSFSSSPPAKRFDVFLSFRGEDTRMNFTAHLSLALRKMGLVFNIFKDDIALDKGKEIGPELLNAIEDSHYAVVVLSKNYADSHWCLKELAKIVDCMGDSGRIRTIFYYVDPSDVRNQKGSFGKAFEKHEKDPRHSSEEVRSWRKALTKVANQSGEPVHSLTDEAIFIEKFVSKISSELGASLRTIDGLFGMSSRLQKLHSYVHQSFATSNVCLIGIHGMGGIGKSTLATAYYKQMSQKFEGSSFLQNVREFCENKPNGLVDLQKQLLSKILKDNFGEIDCVSDGIDMIRSRLHSKKVLIVLDDVYEEDQLDGLAGEDFWFGSGSIIIVTTRDDSFLKNRKYKIYEAEYLNPSESLELFSWKAFRSTEPPKDYKKLSEQVVEYASNLPLALTVLGSLLGRKHKSLWNGILCRLRKCPEKKIVEILKISFDDLNETDKCIFLDIACFFNRYDTDSVIEILDSYGFDSKYGISNLIDKSLLRINGVMWMHDLLQEMGKEIVQNKSGNQLTRQSRIWDADDFYQILKNKEGTNEVEAILTYVESKFLHSFEVLSSMKKLRLLQIKSHFERRQMFNLLDDCDVPELSNNLQYLDWSGFPYNKLPSSFQPHNLVQLKLRYSKIKQLWNNGIEPLCYLKVIDLTGSRSLTKLEDFAVVPNLETLILSDCRKLLEIHPSIKHLSNLIILDMSYCLSLKKLPEEINGLSSLQILNLYYCHKLEKLPDNMEQLKCLRKLEIRSCRIKHLPSSIFLMENLEIQYDDVTMIEFAIRENIKNYRTTGKCFHTDSFTSLTWLDLNDCKLIGPEAFPEYFSQLACLEYLDLSKNPFSVLPPGINGLSRLRCLRLEHCKNLRCLEAELLPSSLQVVYVNYCTSLASFLDPLKPCHLRCSSVFCFDCTELVKRQDGKMTALASLSIFLDQDSSKRRDGSQTLQDSSKRRDADFKFVIPQSDNELPSWFMNQSSTTTSISIKLDPECHNSELIGFALAFCFRADSAQIVFGCNLRVGNSEDWETEIQVNVKETGMLDHLFLMYSRCDDTTLECIKQLEPTSSDNLEFSFYNICYKGCTSFGPCGVRLVYEEDIEGLKEITSNYNNDQKVVQSSNSQSISQLSKLRNMGPTGLPLWTGLRGILDLKDDLEIQQYADEDRPNNPEGNPSMVGNTYFGVIRNYIGITTKLLDNLKGGREAE